MSAKAKQLRSRRFMGRIVEIQHNQAVHVYVQDFDKTQWIDFQQIQFEQGEQDNIEIGDFISCRVIGDRFTKPVFIKNGIMHQVQAIVKQQTGEILQVELNPPFRDIKFENIKIQDVQLEIKPDDQIFVEYNDNGKFIRSIFKQNQPQNQISHNLVRHSFEENPQTVGMFRLPIKTYKNLYMYSQQFQQQSQYLQAQVSAWRKARGDGNCYYRAVGFLFIEHLFRQTTSIQQFQIFYQQLQAEIGYFSLNHYLNDKNCRNDFIRYIELLMQAKQQKDRKTLETTFQSLDFDRIFIRELRGMALNYFRSARNQQPLSDFVLPDTYELIERDIINLGTEAEGVIFNLLPNVLQISISHISFLDRLEQAIFSPSKPGIYPIIYISYRKGHYDLLYSHVQSIIDGYNSKNMSLDDKSQTFVQNDYIKNALCYQVAEKEQPPSEQNYEMASVISELSSYIINFPGGIDILKSTLSNIQDSETSEEVQSKLPAELKSILYYKCIYCSRPGKVQLKCRHYICENDLQEITDQAFKSKRLAQCKCGDYIDSQLSSQYYSPIISNNSFSSNSGQYQSVPVQTQQSDIIYVDTNSAQNSIYQTQSLISPQVSMRQIFYTPPPQSSCSFCGNQQVTFKNSLLNLCQTCSELYCTNCNQITQSTTLWNGNYLCNNCLKQLASNNEDVFLQCTVCKKLCLPEDVKENDCGCSFCSQCLINIIQSNRNQLQRATCERCKLRISNKLIQPFIQSEQPNHHIEQGPIRFQCIKCNFSMITPQPITQCPKCPTSPQKNSIKPKNAKTCACPLCGTTYQKEESIPYKQCTAKNCQQLEFCTICNVLRSPIMAHGAQYHKPDCLLYEDRQNETWEVGCIECVKLGKTCKRPVQQFF